MDDTHESLPESAPASPVPNSVSDAGDAPEEPSSPQPDPYDLNHLPAEIRSVVRRLYQQVQTAINTIEELRAENEQLRQRVQELESTPDLPDDETILALDKDPEEVRARITQFINTIDTYLDTAPTSETAADESSS